MIEIKFEGLEELIAGVEKLSEEGLGEVSDELAHEAVMLSQDCFQNDKDPYSVDWDDWVINPPIRPHIKLMMETGAIHDSINAIDVNRNGFILGSFGAISIDGKSHAHYHQDGTTRMPPRKFIPDDRGLPTSWFPVFVDVFDDIIRRMLF